MTTIHINHRESDQSVNLTEEALEELAMTDPDWNGASFAVIRDDCTWIDAENEIAAAQLLNEIIWPNCRH